MDVSPSWMLLRTGRYQVGSDGCSPDRMLLETERYTVGSDGCSPAQMLLGTERYQVGRDGCSPDRTVKNGQKMSRIFLTNALLRKARLSAKTHYVLHTKRLDKSEISRMFVKNAFLYAKTHYVFAFEPPPQSAEIVLNAHEKVMKCTKMPGAWRMCHQLQTPNLHCMN